MLVKLKFKIINFIIFLFVIVFSNYGNAEPTDITGNFSIRYWLGNNSFDQIITGDINNLINIKSTNNIIELHSDYWFGLIFQQQLYKLGPFFGMGFSFSYSQNNNSILVDGKTSSESVQIYILDFDFIKLALFHDEELKKLLMIYGNFISYYNGYHSVVGENYVGSRVIGAISGPGIGVSVRYDLWETGDLYFKINYLPFLDFPIPFSDGWGANTELGIKCFINSNVSFNVGYKFSYYFSELSRQGQIKQNDQVSNVSFKINFQDFLHGLSLGTTIYF